jgi:septum formation protein
VRRLAREKATLALEDAPAGTVSLGADTTVVLDGECLGKPADEAEARQMLARLSGRSHQVMTGVCVAWLPSAESSGPDCAGAGRPASEVQALAEAEVTEVEFATLTEEEIADYVATGEPMDKAGAYAIQGRASRWIPRIRGCYFNVVGLPVAQVCALLKQAPDKES